MNQSINQFSQQFSKIGVEENGVSFKGKSLKLDSENDCNEVVDAIKACKSLQFLNLEGNTLGVGASKAISKALESKSELKAALWKDMFTGRMKEEIPKALEYLGNGLTIAGAQLTELDLSDNAFGPIGIQGLAQLLSSRCCYQLQLLKLNNNGLGISGGKILAQALLKCHKNSVKEGKALALKLFIAGRNRLENDGAAALSDVFQTLGTLEEIVMPQNGIYHKGIEALSISFKKNPNLKVLDLSDNTLTKKGAVHIADALPYVQKLKVLNLGECLLKTSGASILARALTNKHSALEELNLSFDEIKLDGALSIVKAMTNKHNLKVLNLNGNQFGSRGQKLLQEELKKNEKIMALGTLSEDESCDDSEGDDDGSISESESSEEENEVEENTNVNVSEINIKPDGDQVSNILSNIGDLSIRAKPEGLLKTFLDHPTPENILNVKEEKIHEFINANKDSSTNFYRETFIPLLVKVSSVSCSSNEEAKKLSSSITETLYKNLFQWATENNQISMVNNNLFVHFGLIKNEDKNFKINWDVNGSLAALNRAVSQKLVPSETRDTLKFLLEKEKAT